MIITLYNNHKEKWKNIFTPKKEETIKKQLLKIKT